MIAGLMAEPTPSGGTCRPKGWRSLHRRRSTASWSVEGFITREPRKRPKASYVRFEASLPNECWQSDMTHYQLADGTAVEILTFIDDYSRLVLGCECYGTVKAPDVRKMFLRCAETFELPASVLTDNGAIYNARSRGGRTGFEGDLAERGVLYKHSTAYHPQTCGKVERWHRTLKGFLSKRPATSLFEFQQVLDEIVTYHNDVRPHQARGRVTPRVAYEGRAKMQRDTLINQPHYRISRDTVDQRGHVTLRYLGKLRHLNVGWRHRGDRIRLYIIDDHVDIVKEKGVRAGEIILDPDRDYQPMTNRFSTQNFTGSSVFDVLKHHRPNPPRIRTRVALLGRD